MASHDLEGHIRAARLRVLSSCAPPDVRAPSPTRPNAALRAADGTRGSHCARPLGGAHDATRSRRGVVTTPNRGVLFSASRRTAPGWAEERAGKAGARAA